MSKLTDRLKRRALEYENDELKDRPTHSHAYHAHFRGWSERRVPGKNGRGSRIERIYTADYRRYMEPDTLWRIKKGYYLLIYLLAAGLFIYGAGQRTGLAAGKSVGAAQMLAVLSLAYLGYTLAFQLLARRLMTIGDYQLASQRMKWSALAASVFVALPPLCMLILRLVTGLPWERGDGSALAGLLCAAFLLFILYRAEAMRTAEWVKNENETPTDANEIW